eukprot:CAMPEP_0115038310 /NCGR_PEP_ID=MMETSP0216-20121206/43335_1 /TAXON_ID=223996 /ORGANISM="Protocruzia adherens, Strain Boccale" /LENGTH=532 /DNA_ID=CAMNT_0002418691 /DNA_START=36 /DNA_END=1634 /DNA_ORIENTATION=+
MSLINFRLTVATLAVCLFLCPVVSGKIPAEYQELTDELQVVASGQEFNLTLQPTAVTEKMDEELHDGGKLCYTDSLEQFEQCADEEQGILMHLTTMNELESKLLKWQSSYGMVIITQGQADRDRVLQFAEDTTSPRVLDTIDQQDVAAVVEEIEKQSNNVADFVYSHHITILCSYFVAEQAILEICMSLWLLVALGWGYNTYFLNKAQSTQCHRAILMIPSLKLLEMTLRLATTFSCPMYQTSLDFVLVLETFFITLYQTSAFCMIILYSKGINITRESVQRDELIKVAVMILIVYLNIFLGLFYMVFAFYLTSEVQKNIQSVSRCLHQAQSMSIDEYVPSLQLKLEMFNIIKYAVIIYFVSGSGWYLMNTVIYEVPTINYLNGGYEFFQIVAVSLFFYVVRSRTYPAMFTVDLNEFQNKTGSILPFYRSQFAPNGLHTDGSDQFDSLNSSEPIVVLQPDFNEAHESLEKETLDQMRLGTSSKDIYQPLLSQRASMNYQYRMGNHGGYRPDGIQPGRSNSNGYNHGAYNPYR